MFCQKIEYLLTGQLIEMRQLSIYLLPILFLVQILQGFGQTSFVTFETTNKSFTVCEGRAFGIIAHIDPKFENYKSYSWKDDFSVIKKTQNDIISINTSKSGEKKIEFTLQLNESEVFDTVITIKILPRPIANILFSVSKNCIELKSKDSVFSYKWMQNDKFIEEFENESFAKPSHGNYKALVKDNNGCIAVTESILIK